MSLIYLILMKSILEFQVRFYEKINFKWSIGSNFFTFFKGNFHICSYTFCHKKNTIIPCQQGHFQHNKSDWQFVQPFSTKNIAHFTRLSGDLTPFFALPLNIKSHPPPRAVVFYSLCVSHFNVQGDDASKCRKLAGERGPKRQFKSLSRTLECYEWRWKSVEYDVLRFSVNGN